jgi:NOL1/NOP2/fmu family ribosome biogenesis protein
LRSCAAYERCLDQSLIPNWCEERFGMPSADFADFIFWHRGGRDEIWIAPTASKPATIGCMVAFGMLVMRQAPPRGKPTSAFLQRFGMTASKNHIILQGSEMAQYLKREPLSIDEPKLTNGHCIVSTVMQVIGCGQWADGVLINVWPKHYTSQLPGQTPIVSPIE